MSDLPAAAEALARLGSAAQYPAPLLGAIGVGVAAAAGLALWAVGGRLVRPLYALLLGAIGAVIGLKAQQALALGGPLPIGVCAGALLGCVSGLMLFRLTMAASLAVALAAATPLVTAWALERDANAHVLFDGLPPWDATPRSEGDAADTSLAEQALEQLRTQLRPVALPIADAGVQAALAASLDRARSDWAALPERTRGILALAAAAGAVFGFAIGLARPRHVAAIATSLTGAAVWLPAALALLPGAGVETARLTPDSPKGWITAWLTAAAVGAMIQIISLHGRADKTAG